MRGAWWVVGLVGLVGCDDGEDRAATAEPPSEQEAAEPEGAGGEETIVPDLPEVPDLAKRIDEELGEGRRPMAVLNGAFVSEPPPTADGFVRYAHPRSCKEVAENLILETFGLAHPQGMTAFPCSESQRHSYVVFRSGEERARERRLAIGAANGNPPPAMIDMVMRRLAGAVGGELEPHEAEPAVVHGSELSTRDYTLEIPSASPTMPGRWAVRAVVVPKPWVRDESGTLRMGGPSPGLLVLLFEPAAEGAATADVLARAAPTLQTVLDSVRFPR